MISQKLIGQLGALVATMSLAVLAIGIGSHLAAQVAGDSAAAPGSADGEPASAPKPKRRHIARKVPAAPFELRSGAGEAAPPAPPADAAPAKTVGPIDFAARLDQAGASACRGQINVLATETMGSVVQFNTMSNWAATAGDKRAVSVAIGQKYADGSAVPFSVSQVISTPNQQGSCDGFSVQVFPSPLPCGKLRETLATRGKQIGDLAGVSLMQDGLARTMLLPTAANTCVLVATRTVYAK